MKIQVVHKDGRKENLTLLAPLTIDDSGIALTAIRCADGMIHYFTNSGFYDGWEIEMDATGKTPQQLKELCEAIDAQREWIG